MEALIQQLRPKSTMRVVKKGGNIFFQGEIPRKAMIVRDGIIRAYTITSGGEERVVALYGRGDIFPLTWVLGETSNTLFYYDAVSEARIMNVDREELLGAVTESPESMSTMLSFVGNQYTSLLLRITGLEQSRAVEKIGFTLYYLLFRYGIEKKPGFYTINMKLSQLMIANLVGLTRESSTKNLKALKEKGVITYSGSMYTVNKQKLEQFLGEDSFRDLTL
jgi:CRP/FNR family cyclic AMP-dependent transcriptional regulator